MVPVVHFVYKTLHKFLPDTLNRWVKIPVQLLLHIYLLWYLYTSDGSTKETVSMIISSQVGSNRISNENAASLLLRNNPIVLKFDHNAVSCQEQNNIKLYIYIYIYIYRHCTFIIKDTCTACVKTVNAGYLAICT